MINKWLHNGFILLVFSSILFVVGSIRTVNAQVLSEVKMSNPSPTSVTITWETDVEAEGLIRYRTAGTSDSFITVQENSGQIRSLSVSKCVASL